jgi:hypothetical protein
MKPSNAMLLAWCASILGACAPTTAVVNGKTVPRVSLGYTDRETYALRHTRAYPQTRGPSSGLWSYGGRLDGTVCGLDVHLEAEYYGRFLGVTGFVAPATTSAGPTGFSPLQIEARDRHGERNIRGTFPGADLRTGVAGFDFKLAGDHLRGHVGARTFDLVRDAEDQLSGTMTIASHRYDFVLDGIDEVWSMPVADQSVLLPLMLSCRYKYSVDERGPQRTVPILTVSFRDKR